MQRVYALQHLATEPLGAIGEALDPDSIDAECVRLFAGDRVPGDMNDAAGLVVMGGSMSVYEQDQYAQTQCQAFAYEARAYGLLFHLEATQRIVEDMVRGFKGELDEEHVEGAGIVAQSREHLARQERIGALVFQRWASLVVRQTEVLSTSAVERQTEVCRTIRRLNWLCAR